LGGWLVGFLGLVGMGMRSEVGLTGPLGSKVLGSAAWSGGSLVGRAERVERKDLAKLSSVMVVVRYWIVFRSSW